MKKHYSLFSFVVLAGFITGIAGCVSYHVTEEVSQAPQGVLFVEEIVPVHEAEIRTVSKHKSQHKRERATTPLIYAVSINNIDGIQYLLKRGENANEVFYSDSYEATPLQEAAKRGNLVAAHHLVRRGANIDLRVNDKTAFEMAVRKNDLEMVQFFVLSKANIYAPNILEDSVRKNDTVILKYLLDNGAAKRTVPAAKRNADYALIKACRLGNVEAMRLLIKAGADISVIDAKGRGLLFYASERNDVIILEFVYPYTRRMINSIDDDGFTPLMIAVERNNMDTVKFLVAKGAYIDIQNKQNQNAVHYSKTAEMIKYLNAEAPRRKTPAGYVAKRETSSKYEEPAKPDQAKSETKPDVKSEIKPEQAKPEEKRESKKDRADKSLTLDIDTQPAVQEPAKPAEISKPEQAAPEQTKPEEKIEKKRKNKKDSDVQPAAQEPVKTDIKLEAKPEQAAPEQTKPEEKAEKKRKNKKDSDVQPAAQEPAKTDVKLEAKPEQAAPEQAKPEEKAEKKRKNKKDSDVQPAAQEPIKPDVKLEAKPEQAVPEQTKPEEKAEKKRKNKKDSADKSLALDIDTPAPQEPIKPAEISKSELLPAQDTTPAQAVPVKQTSIFQKAAPQSTQQQNVSNKSSALTSTVDVVPPPEPVSKKDAKPKQAKPEQKKSLEINTELQPKPANTAPPAKPETKPVQQANPPQPAKPVEQPKPANTAPQAKPETKSESKPAAKQDVKPETKPEPKPEEKIEQAKPEQAKPETKKDEKQPKQQKKK